MVPGRDENGIFMPPSRRGERIGGFGIDVFAVERSPAGAPGRAPRRRKVGKPVQEQPLFRAARRGLLGASAANGESRWKSAA